MGKSKAAKAEVPECRFGIACTRKGCVYRHPPKSQRAAIAASTEKSDRVCFAFVAGRCAFGRQCHDRHPDPPSCQTIRDKYAKIDCQWGRNCRTEGCLYRHPSDEVVGPPMPKAQFCQPVVMANGPLIRPGMQTAGVLPASPPRTTRQTPGGHSASSVGVPVWRAAEAVERSGPPDLEGDDPCRGAFVMPPLGRSPTHAAPPEQESAGRAQHAAEEPTNREEDEEEAELHRAEALARMLRCMGFDEEASLPAAQRAGGNLNIAVEAALQGLGGQAPCGDQHEAG